MDIDLESLYQTVDQLPLEHRAKLLLYLMRGQRSVAQGSPQAREWQFDLARGLIQTTPDFDDPLPDRF